MNIGHFLTAKTGPLPNWVWGSVIVVGLGVGFFIVRKQMNAANNPSPTPSQTAAADSTTPGYDPTGSNQHDVLVVPIGNFTTSSSASDTNEPMRSSGRSPNSNPIPPKQIGTIRERYSINIPSVKKYDELSPNGVPVRPVPGSSLEAYKVKYGSTIELLGTPVQGPSNVKETAMGSTSWYPVHGGYLSAMDVTGVSQQYSTVSQSNQQTQTVHNA